MADAFNRTTKEFRRSVNEPDHPPSEWIHSPVINGLPFRDAGVPNYYVNVAGDSLLEMSTAEKAVVDLQREEEAKAAALTLAKSAYDELYSLGRALALVIMDELNNQHTAKLNALLDAIDAATSLATLKATVATINNIPTRTPGDLKAAMNAKLEADS